MWRLAPVSVTSPRLTEPLTAASRLDRLGPAVGDDHGARERRGEAGV